MKYCTRSCRFFAEAPLMEQSCWVTFIQAFLISFPHFQQNCHKTMTTFEFCLSKRNLLKPLSILSKPLGWIYKQKKMNAYIKHSGLLMLLCWQMSRSTGHTIFWIHQHLAVLNLHIYTQECICLTLFCKQRYVWVLNPTLINLVQGDPKKCIIRILSSNLF